MQLESVNRDPHLIRNRERAFRDANPQKGGRSIRKLQRKDARGRKRGPARTTESKNEARKEDEEHKEKQRQALSC